MPTRYERLRVADVRSFGSLLALEWHRIDCTVGGHVENAVCGIDLDVRGWCVDADRAEARTISGKDMDATGPARYRFPCESVVIPSGTPVLGVSHGDASKNSRAFPRPRASRSYATTAGRLRDAFET